LFAWREFHPGSHEPHPGPLGLGRVDVTTDPVPCAVVAPAAPFVDAEGGIIELNAQKRHPALIGVLIVEHGLLLAAAGLVQRAVARFVVLPPLTCGDPAALDAPHGAVDVEHLEHHLQARAAEVDQRLQCRSRLGPLEFQGTDHVAHHGF
jgi:hypothetical protein